MKETDVIAFFDINIKKAEAYLLRPINITIMNMN